MTELLGLSPTDWQRDKPVISAHWGARSESADVVAARLDRTLAVVEAAGGPARDAWRYAVDVMEPWRPLPTTPDELEPVIRGLVVTGDDGRPSEASGYGILLESPGAGEDSATTISAHVGSRLTHLEWAAESRADPLARC